VRGVGVRGLEPLTSRV